jgi:hypothetical protein
MRPFLTTGRAALVLSAVVLASCDTGGTITLPDDPNLANRLPAQATQVTINSVYSGPPPWTPGVISLQDQHVIVEILNIEQYLGRSASPSAVRIGPSWTAGTPAQQFQILDINNDGNRDIRLRWSLQQLVNNGHLSSSTTQLAVWGRDPGSGQEFTGTATVRVGTPQPGGLATAPANNGTGGVFLDLTPTAPLRVLSFETPFGGTAGTTLDVEVWTRPGSYVGFDGSAEGWTLTQTVQVTRQGTTTNALIDLQVPLTLPAGQTTGVYLQAIGASGGGIRYTGTGASPPQTTWSNNDVTLFSDVARVATAAFTGSRFTPRTFSGNVNYQVISN